MCVSCKLMVGLAVAGMKQEGGQVTKKRKIKKRRLADEATEKNDIAAHITKVKQKGEKGKATLLGSEVTVVAPKRRKKRPLAESQPSSPVVKAKARKSVKRLKKTATSSRAQESAIRPLVDVAPVDTEDANSSEDSFFTGDDDKKASFTEGIEDAGKTSDEFKVFVGDLPWSLSEDAVRAHFAEYGGVERFDMPKNREGLPDGIAFIYYKTKDAMEQALKMDGCSFHGRTIKVRRAVPQKRKGGSEIEDNTTLERQLKDKLTVFVGGLSFDTDMEVLKRDFEECGEIDSIRTLKDDHGGFKGTAFIVFKKDASVQEALKWHDSHYAGRTILVRRAGGKAKGDSKGDGKDGSKGKGSGKGKGHGKDKTSSKSQGKGDGKDREWNHDHDRTIFVGSLPTDTEQHHLLKDFGECGQIEKVRMLTDADGWFKGAAFVVFKTSAGSKKALEWDGKEYGDRAIKVSLAQSKPKRE